MIEKLTEAAIAFFVISGLAYLIGAGIAAAAENTVRKRQEGAGLDGRLQRLMILAQRLEQRKEKMLPNLVKLDAEVKSARRRQYMVNKKLLDLKTARSQLMRVLGEEDGFLRAERPARKFIAQVVNRHVQRAQMEQKEHPFLSRAWSRTQQAVIWAPTVGDAKILAEKSFPPATGFFIAEITEPHSEGDELSALEQAKLAALTQEGAASP
ncbi:hypothetical protein CHU95_17905 [Niveispirillum lacus]|uniref:Uncharacterized protein n=1 Tax=Niveispirillum lacus TaxID=1981099 RepID=A0A255YTT4_9PROT|nr:hypothetical protein [Niveispirillum lacus]OYQ32647.1 hypothetical protein CHU95_17905 [Niveispirillum lacus]